MVTICQEILTRTVVVGVRCVRSSVLNWNVQHLPAFYILSDSGKVMQSGRRASGRTTRLTNEPYKFGVAWYILQKSEHKFWILTAYITKQKMKSKREFGMSHKLYPKSAVLLLMICCGQGLIDVEAPPVTLDEWFGSQWFQDLENQWYCDKLISLAISN
jgi:hypothetical protein